MLKKFKEGIIFGLGMIFIMLFSGFVYASYNWVVQSEVSVGEILSADSWNELMNNQNYLKEQIEGIVDTNTQLTEEQVDDYVSNNGYLTNWPNGNYCILRAGGTCPAGFTESSGYIKAFQGYANLNTSYYSNTMIGDSHFRSHGGDTFPYGALADIILYACCK